jgi:hypothetical protein
MLIIEGKVVLGVGCIALGTLLATNARLLALSERRFRLLVFAVWMLTRLGLFSVVFLGLRM